MTWFEKKDRSQYSGNKTVDGDVFCCVPNGFLGYKRIGADKDLRGISSFKIKNV